MIAGADRNLCAQKRGVGGMQYGTSGLMPRAEFLYVKWRGKSTGQVYEDRENCRFFAQLGVLLPCPEKQEKVRRKIPLEISERAYVEPRSGTPRMRL